MATISFATLTVRALVRASVYASARKPASRGPSGAFHGARGPLARTAGIAIAVVALTPVGTAYAAESAAGILDAARATYAALKSYSDTGTVTEEFGPSARSQHTFTTRFNREPRGFLFAMHKEGGDRLVVWADPGAFHVWWKATGAQTDYPNPNNSGAITLNDFPTVGAITKMTSLLYSKAGLVSSLSNATLLEGTPMEDIAGQRCYRLTGTTKDFYGQSGRSVNTRTLTIWIDARTHLVRQIREEGPSAPGSRNRTTTVFEPLANPALGAESFIVTAEMRN